MPTNVVTLRAGSVAVNPPSTTGMAGCDCSAALSDVSHGVTASTVPPAIVKICSSW